MNAPYPLPEAELKALLRQVRSRVDVSDPDFDRIFPAWARRLSERHWTPVDVARRAAFLLCPDRSARILDVGAGVGKFCILGSLVTGATFLGVEQRTTFVQTACEVANQVGATQAQFLHGNACDVDWRPFDGIYLFNPFYEHISSSAVDLSIEPILRSPDSFYGYVEMTLDKLAETAEGTRVALYHGFGGVLPDSFHLVHCEPIGGSSLELYVKGTRVMRSKPTPQRHEQLSA